MIEAGAEGRLPGLEQPLSPLMERQCGPFRLHHRRQACIKRVGHVQVIEHQREFPSMPKKILIVDDDPDIRSILEDRLCAHGYSVACAGDASAALSALDQGEFDLVLLDVELPGAK